MASYTDISSMGPTAQCGPGGDRAGASTAGGTATVVSRELELDQDTCDSSELCDISNSADLGHTQLFISESGDYSVAAGMSN